MPGNRDRPDSAQWIINRHSFAAGRYQEANIFGERIEKLFKAEYEPVRDTADKANAGTPDIIQPARGRAILERILTMLTKQANTSLKVMPAAGKSGKSEQEATSRLEQFLGGYQVQFRMETRHDPWRDFWYWYLLRGRGVIETRYEYSYAQNDYLPIRTIVDDPAHIYTIWGRDGVNWYTKEYNVWTYEIKETLERQQAAGRDVSIPASLAGDMDFKEQATVVEYWNAKYTGLNVDNHLCWSREHGYGFVPIAEAHCKATPLESMRWAYQSVLGPIASSLEQMYTLVSKLLTGVDLFYYPLIIERSASNRISVYTAEPGFVHEGSPDSKIEIFNPKPNNDLIQDVMQFLLSDIQLGSVPEIAFGQGVSGSQSGFSIAQVLNTVIGNISDFKDPPEMALGWHYGHILMLAEKFIELGGNYTVPVIAPTATKRISVPGSTKGTSMSLEYA